jgi:hypothetical protein
MNRQLHFICQDFFDRLHFETGSRLISDEWLIVGFKASLSTSYFGFGIQDLFSFVRYSKFF